MPSVKNGGGMGFVFTGDDSSYQKAAERTKKTTKEVSKGFEELATKGSKQHEDLAKAVEKSFKESQTSNLEFTEVAEKDSKRVEKANFSLSESFSKLKGKIANFASGAVGAFKNGYGKAASFVDGIVEKAANHDTGYDSTIAEFNKSFSALRVGMNLTTAEANKWQAAIIQTHYKTGESLDDMGKGLLEFKKQGIDVEKAFGQKGLEATMTRMAKISSVFGIESSKLADVYGRLEKTFGFTDVQAKALGDRMFTIGKVFNIGREAVQQWPDIIEDLSKEFAAMGRVAKPGEIAATAESIVKLGGALSTGLGKPAEESLALSRQIFGTIMAERKNIIGMFSGTSGELGELSMQLTETGGDVEKTFAMIQADPMKFMKSLQVMAHDTKVTTGSMGPQFQRLTTAIDKTLGSDATNLMKGNWDAVQKKMKELPSALKGTEDAMGKAADAAHKFVGSGSWVDMLMLNMDRHIRTLTASSYVQWQKNVTDGFHSTEAVMSRLASTEGPVGNLTKRLLMMQRVGLSGLFTQDGAGKAGAAFGAVATQATGALMAMQKLGIRLSDLPALLSAGGPILAGFALFDDGLREDIIGGISSAADWLEKNGPEYLEKATSKFGQVFSKIDWKEVGTKMAHGIRYLASFLGDTLSDAWEEFFDQGSKAESLGGSIVDAVKGTVGGLWDAIGWDDIMKKMGLYWDIGWGIMKIGFFEVIKPIRFAWVDFTASIGKAMTRMGNAISESFSEVWDENKKGWIAIKSGANSAALAIVQAFSKGGYAIGVVWHALMARIEGALASFFTKIQAKAIAEEFTKAAGMSQDEANKPREIGPIEQSLLDNQAGFSVELGQVDAGTKARLAANQMEVDQRDASAAASKREILAEDAGRNFVVDDAKMALTEMGERDKGARVVGRMRSAISSAADAFGFGSKGGVSSGGIAGKASPIGAASAAGRVESTAADATSAGASTEAALAIARAQLGALQGISDKVGAPAHVFLDGRKVGSVLDRRSGADTTYVSGATMGSP